ncbi:MAG: hypothetical protein ACYTGP_11385 [Planctomycetota bacterium]
MSVIVAVRKFDTTVIAADSLTCFGDSQRVPQANAVTPKVRRIGTSLVGASGWAVYDSIITDFLADRPPPDLTTPEAIFSFFMVLWRAMHDNYSFVNDQAQSKDSPFGDLDSTFLIANRGGIFKVSPDMDVSGFQQYYAIGSGSEYALGAMHHLYETDQSAEVIARKAVDTATQFDLYCGGAINVMTAE